MMESDGHSAKQNKGRDGLKTFAGATSTGGCSQSKIFYRKVKLNMSGNHYRCAPMAGISRNRPGCSTWDQTGGLHLLNGVQPVSKLLICFMCSCVCIIVGIVRSAALLQHPGQHSVGSLHSLLMASSLCTLLCVQQASHTVGGHPEQQDSPTSCLGDRERSVEAEGAGAAELHPRH